MKLISILCLLLFIGCTTRADPRRGDAHYPPLKEQLRIAQKEYEAARSEVLRLRDLHDEHFHRVMEKYHREVFGNLIDEQAAMYAVDDSGFSRAESQDLTNKTLTAMTALLKARMSFDQQFDDRNFPLRKRFDAEFDAIPDIKALGRANRRWDRAKIKLGGIESKLR